MSDKSQTSSWSISHAAAEYLHSIPDDHPIQIALRTYAISLSLSLGPTLVPFVASPKAREGGTNALKRALKREFGLSGFAFAMTVGVGGGAALKRFLKLWEGCVTASRDQRSSQKSSQSSGVWLVQERLGKWLSFLKDSHKTFICYAISAALAMALLQSRRGYSKFQYRASIPMTAPITDSQPKSTKIPGKASATLDLTLLLLVRALDSLVRSIVLPSVDISGERTEEYPERVRKRRQQLTTRLDAFVFWASSARIMWCFFYDPERLPRSYNKWIMSVANIDPRILGVLRAIRSGAWSYTKGFANPPDLATSLSRDLGYPPSWGDPSLVPAYGGPAADAAWRSLGVKGRNGVGGFPCELVHGGVTGGSCVANAGIRGTQTFVKAIAIYLPVHFLPILLTRPKKLVQAPQIIRTLLSVFRSASFLSTFVSSIWLAVCLTRTLLLARLFPWIPHDFWDGPFGCTFAGSLVCGSSIWIEQGRRRGEMALYVLPRAIRACLPEAWLRSGRSVRVIERLAFVLSLASLLTAWDHRADSLRGLSRWTLAFVMNGPNAGFWKRKRQDTSPPATPVDFRSPRPSTSDTPDIHS